MRINFSIYLHKIKDLNKRGGCTDNGCTQRTWGFAMQYACYAQLGRPFDHPTVSDFRMAKRTAKMVHNTHYVHNRVPKFSLKLLACPSLRTRVTTWVMSQGRSLNHRSYQSISKSKRGKISHGGKSKRRQTTQNPP